MLLLISINFIFSGLFICEFNKIITNIIIIVNTFPVFYYNFKQKFD